MQLDRERQRRDRRPAVGHVQLSLAGRIPLAAEASWNPIVDGADFMRLVQARCTTKRSRPRPRRPPHRGHDLSPGRPRASRRGAGRSSVFGPGSQALSHEDEAACVIVLLDRPGRAARHGSARSTSAKVALRAGANDVRFALPKSVLKSAPALGIRVERAHADAALHRRLRDRPGARAQGQRARRSKKKPARHRSQARIPHSREAVPSYAELRDDRAFFATLPCPRRASPRPRRRRRPPSRRPPGCTVSCSAPTSRGRPRSTGRRRSRGTPSRRAHVPVPALDEQHVPRQRHRLQQAASRHRSPRRR